MLQDCYPYYLSNRAEYANADLVVTDKYTGEVATRVALADEAAIDRAIAATVRASKSMREMPIYERQAILRHCAGRFEQKREILAMAVCIEAGKPIKDSRVEVDRLIDTFELAAQELVRPAGELLNLEISPRARGYHGVYKRVPIGPCSFISPFNFPLNLAAHKVAPAIATGCPFVLKPASRTPVSALLMAEILAETDLPDGSFSILPSSRAAAEQLTTDERLKLLSFTGSSDVGWELKNKAGRKKVLLELGGNAACVVDEDADLDDAVDRITTGAFYQSGQSCISVQRVLIHENLYDEFRARFVEAAQALTMGDPKAEETFIGPLISEDEAIRLESWIGAALEHGARLLCGGYRQGVMFPATVMEEVPPDLPLAAEEAFGPVAILSKFADFEQALDEVNASPFGLQAGVFTRDLYKAQRAWDRLEVGGVIIGDIPSWRVENMPYGGVKASGFGREGLRFAMEEMTELRLLVVRDAGQA